MKSSEKSQIKNSTNIHLCSISASKRTAFKSLILEDTLCDENAFIAENYQRNVCARNLPELEQEVDSNYRDPLDGLEGRRIVDLAHVLNENENITSHSQKCTMGKMRVLKETRRGLTSKLHFYCDNCEKSQIISTNTTSINDDINKSAVWGSLSTGLGHRQCEELFGVLNITFMSEKTYMKTTSDVKKCDIDEIEQRSESSDTEQDFEDDVDDDIPVAATREIAEIIDMEQEFKDDAADYVPVAAIRDPVFIERC
ncbi:hypothetical protein QE152_g33441 [Popillia japonica]|uniref:Mutator-like transposase domain-containing protein n=1 Tax=Popillia japonica TaxID=7064 RepID=A0AAW1IX94_POPJA